MAPVGVVAEEVAVIDRGFVRKGAVGAGGGDVAVVVAVVKEVGDEGREIDENAVGALEVGESGGDGGRIRYGGILFRSTDGGDDLGTQAGARGIGEKRGCGNEKSEKDTATGGFETLSSSPNLCFGSSSDPLLGRGRSTVVTAAKQGAAVGA